MKHRILLSLFIVLFLPIVVCAEELKVNDTFEVSGITYKVTNVSPREVQVGIGGYNQPAIDASTTGSLALPSRVTGPDKSSYSVKRIGEGAFYKCGEITAITIPSSVNTIGNAAFEYCEKLTKVNFPTNSITEIGSQAFWQCKSLTTITIPNSVTSIGNQSFNECISLTSVTLSSKMTVIESELFRNCTALTSVSIPNSITTVGKDAFYGCSSLETITLPNSVKVIEDDAFFNCKKLATVKLGNRIESIGQYAFGNCYKLEELTLPTSLITIADRGLSQCGLKSITIPRSVKNIGYQVLFADYSLSSITVESQNSKYDSRNSCNAIICKENNELIQGCPYSTIPEGVISIGRGAFLYCPPRDFKLPNTLVSIGEYAFGGVGGGSSPETLFIPKSVKEIGDGAFDNWTSLTSIIVEEGNTAFDTRDGCNALIRTSTNELIRGCYNSFIPNTVMAIGAGAFSSIGYHDDIPGFASITIPNSVTKIGDAAFRYCHKLTSVKLPSALKSIEQEAFYGCYHLTSITIPASIEEINRAAFFDCNTLSAVISLSDNPVEIGEKITFGDGRYSVFGDYESATLFVPVGCKSKYEATDGWNKFKNIKEMDCIFSEKTAEGVEITYEVTSQTPKDCRVLFADANAQGRVTIPNYANGYKVTGIKDYAFYKNKGLTTVDTGSSVVNIGKSAFSGCTGLTSAIIGKSVTTIGNNAFSMCESLISVTIGKSVTSIGSSAFWGTKSLKEVKSLITDPFAIEDRVFSYYDSEQKATVFSNATLYVPAGTKAKYEATDGWKNFKDIVEMSDEDKLTYSIDKDGQLAITGTIDGEEKTIEIPQKIVIDGREYIVTIIAADAFKDNTNLQSITIPETVKEIGTSAFSGCSSLSAVILPEKVNAIGEGAFSGCSSIKTIELPKSVNSIGDGAFKDCSSMSSVKILSSPENVGTDVFAGCDNLKEAEFDCATVTPVLQKTKVERVKMEEAVTAIDKEAFLECKNLADIDIPESVERIGESAFNGCTGIKQIELTKNLNTIGDGAFTGCTEMKLVKVECSPTNVGTDIFDKCEKLEEAVFDCPKIMPILRRTKVERVKIEKSVTAIDKEAFLECKNLAAIDIPESVERIGESAFNGCTGIKAIELPKSVTQIEEGAFGKCTEMITLKIGEGIKEIQSAAFSDCVKLTDVFVYAKELPTTSNEAFKDTDVKQITLHVPEEAVKDYERTAPWIDFKIIKPIVPEAISIVMASSKPVDVYSTAGVLLKQGVMTLKDLKKGVYVIGTRKVLVK